MVKRQDQVLETQGQAAILRVASSVVCRTGLWRIVASRASTAHGHGGFIASSA
jgi:hypothetical protein